MTPSLVRDHDLASAPAGSRQHLEATQRHLGFIPIGMARQAEAPEVLDAFAQLNRLWARGELTEREREVVIFTVAHHSGCDLCLAFHDALLRRSGDATLAAELRAEAPLGEERLAALRRFTRALLASRGDVPDDERAAFLAAGFSPRHALEVVLGVATYTLSTYANRLVRAPVDPQLRP
jgi:AhpD family alkylhydroperoxidase